MVMVMNNKKVIAKITLGDLRKYADDHDYDWKTEIVPVLDKLIEYVELNLDIKATCSLALGKVLGAAKKRRARW